MYITYTITRDWFFGTSLTALVSPKKATPAVAYSLGQIKPKGILDRYKVLCTLYVWYRVLRIKGKSSLI